MRGSMIKLVAIVMVLAALSGCETSDGPAGTPMEPGTLHVHMNGQVGASLGGTLK